MIGDERVDVTPVEGKFNAALPISSNKCPAYDGLKIVVRQVLDNLPVVPFTMLGGTDCQHFVPCAINFYRVTSVVMDESFSMEHGIDERIRYGDGEDRVIAHPTDESDQRSPAGERTDRRNHRSACVAQKPANAASSGWQTRSIGRSRRTAGAKTDKIKKVRMKNNGFCGVLDLLLLPAPGGVLPCHCACQPGDADH